MGDWFDVGHLEVERLLKEWRWLCPQAVALVARNAFGDLYLRDEEGRVSKLDVAIGQMQRVAESEKEFRELGFTAEKREEWFAESDWRAAQHQGLKPGKDQCIAFKIPIVLAESGKPNQAYVADLYELVSFLGDLHRQMKDLPEGAKVRLRITE